MFNRVIKTEILDKSGGTWSFSEFRTIFDIKMDETKTANTCEVSIFGLSENRTDFIMSTGKKINLYVGYEDESEELLYSGDIKQTSIDITKPERILKIYSGTGIDIMKTSKISISYKPGTSIKEVLTNVSKVFNIPTIQNIGNSISNIFKNGFSFNGYASDVMDKLTKAIGLKWNIQNDTLQIYSDNVLNKININQNTGMIGSPTKIKIKIGNIEYDGWEVISLCQPKAIPGSLVTLTSKIVGDDCEFKIITSSHSGDNFEGNMQTKMQIIEV